MRRAALLVFLTLLTFNVSGLAALCGDPPCDESCPTDASGGECPPNCHFCSCCSLPKAVDCRVAALIVPPQGTVAWMPSIAELTSPEPAAILHVPKLPRA